MTGLDHRSVALDVHKTDVVVGAVASDQTVVLRPRRIPLAQFASWAKPHVRPTDQVVLEATTNAWDLYARQRCAIVLAPVSRSRTI